MFAEHPEVEVVPGYSARAITSGGTMRDEDFLRIASEFLEAVRNARDVDAIYFSLHGAFASETEHDIEGYLLAETRKIVGERMPIVTSLDLHGILTDRIAENCDAIVLYHAYPDVDFFQTGERAARQLLRILAREVNPVSARVPIPAIVRGNELKTAPGFVRPMRPQSHRGRNRRAGAFRRHVHRQSVHGCARSMLERIHCHRR